MLSVTALIDRYPVCRKPGKPTALKGKVAQRQWCDSVAAGTAPQQSVTGPCSRNGFRKDSAPAGEGFPSEVVETSLLDSPGVGSQGIPPSHRA